MMHISFYPPLGAHALVPVCLPTGELQDNRDGVHAALTARLSPQDYAEAVRTGLRIEAWTNAPSKTQPTGEWGPVTFEEVTETANAPNGEELEPYLMLSGDDQSKSQTPVEAQNSRTHVFRASLTLPRHPGRIFAFTYRLVYPSGICWLGSDRDNGVLELDAGGAFFEEIGSWKTHEGRRVFVDERHSEQSTNEEDCALVGKLDVTEWSWAGWATDGSKVWSFNDNCLEPIGDARLIFLIPTALNDAVLMPQTLVFHAPSKETRFSITTHGHVLLHPYGQSASIAYRAHDCNSEGDLELLSSEILSSCSAPHIFSPKSTDTILFTPSYDSETSVTIYAQALTRTPSPPRSISFPITALDSFAKHAATICLFVPETRSTVFVDRSEHPRDLTVRFGPGGAQVAVSTVYDLTDGSSHSSWQLSLPECTTAPERTAMPSSVENPLPTPPASPRTKPQRTVSFVLPLESNDVTELRQRKPTESSSPAPERSTVARRLLRSDSAFERYQNASGGEKTKVLIINLLKLLTRFMGIAVLRFILFASRLFGGRQLEVKSPRAENSNGENSAISSAPHHDTSDPGTAAAGEIASGSYVESESPSSVEKDVVETPYVQYPGAPSTEMGDEGPDLGGKQESSLPQASAFRSEPPVLKWILSSGDDTPIKVLIRSEATPDDIFKHYSIELNGVDIETSSSVYKVADKTNIIEATRPEGPSPVLLVKPRAQV